MQRLEGLARKAIQDYEMIQAGDRVCVGISGGKDSMALVTALAHLRKYLGRPFSLVAVTLDPRFGGTETDYSPLEEYFRQLDVEYHVIRTDIGKIVFEDRKEPNPCALCAKFRRGMLHNAAKEFGCNKVALGHHLDDAIETFYMNLWNEGRIGCFSPVTYLSKKDVTLIRPLLLATEADVRHAVARCQLPVVKSRCPVDGHTTREKTKDFVTEMAQRDKTFRQKTLTALQDSGIDGWRPVHTGRMKERVNQDDSI